MPNALVPIALYGWIPAVLLLFALVKPRRAVLVSFIGAWLFLPQAAIPLAGLPDLTKTTATSLAALLGVLVFDVGRLVRLRPSWADLPMAAWCLAPLASSLDNGRGLYDGLAELLVHLMTWGVPYLMGRLYLDDLAGLRDLAIAIVIGGMLYVPLCLFELRMSPQLHRLVYGFHPSPFVMTVRYGGYRPMVFMQHGLMVGMWMTSATLAAVWLWRARTVREILHLPLAPVAGVLLVVTVLCKSTGALVLLAGGLGLLFACRRLPAARLAVLAAVAVAPGYAVLRANGAWSGEQLVRLASSLDEERADSLAGRLENEDLIVEKALRRPLFGWGGWGRWRVTDDAGRDITVSDGMWVITLGRNGVVGLAALLGAVLLPVVLLVRWVPPRRWSMPALAPAAALAVMLVLFSMDMLLNAMINPIYVLGMGGLTGLALACGRHAARRSRAAAAAGSAAAAGRAAA